MQVWSLRWQSWYNTGIGLSGSLDNGSGRGKTGHKSRAIVRSGIAVVKVVINEAAVVVVVAVAAVVNIIVIHEHFCSVLDDLLAPVAEGTLQGWTHWLDRWTYH